MNPHGSLNKIWPFKLIIRSETSRPLLDFILFFFLRTSMIGFLSHRQHPRRGPARRSLSLHHALYNIYYIIHRSLVEASENLGNITCYKLQAWYKGLAQQLDTFKMLWVYWLCYPCIACGARGVQMRATAQLSRKELRESRADRRKFFRVA